MPPPRRNSPPRSTPARADRTLAPTPAAPRTPVGWFAPMLVGLIALAVFLPTLRNGFVDWDDDRNITSNPDFRGLAWTNIKWAFSTTLMGHFQPLSWLTLSVDHAIWGMNPLGYHLTNSVLHGTSAGLLALVVARLLNIRPGSEGNVAQPGTKDIWLGAAVALLWAVHPLRVEAVVWVTQRREVLCSVLTLLTILHHLRGGRWWSVAALAALAMMAKATAVVLPVLLVLIDLYRAGTFGKASLSSIPTTARAVAAALVRHGTLIALSIACSLMAIRAQHAAAALVDVQQLGWAGRLVEYGYSMWFYLLKTVWPSHLLPLYEAATTQVDGVVKVVVAPYVPGAIGGFALVVLGVLAGWIWRARLPWLLPLALAYPAMIAPVGGLGQAGPQVAADRYTYQPGWLITLILAACAWWALSHAGAKLANGAAAIVSCSLAAILAVLSVSREAIWRTSLDLWTYTVKEDPACGTAQYNLGMVYEQITPADDIKAEPYLREALRLHPWMADRNTALAALLVRKGDVDQAIALYRAALKTDPNLKPTLFLLANLLFTRGDLDGALSLFDRLAALDPNQPESYRTLGRALAAANRGPDAAHVLDEGVKRCPNSGELWQQRAWLAATSTDDRARDGAKAVESAERALALAGITRPSALIVCVAASYAEAGRFDDAVKFLEASIPLADPQARGPLGNMREQMLARQPVRAPARFP